MATACVSVNSLISTELVRNQLEKTKPRTRSKSLGGKSRSGSRGSEEEEEMETQRVRLSRSISKPSQERKSAETREDNAAKSSPDKTIWEKLRDRSPIKRSSDNQSDLAGRMNQMSINEGQDEPWGNASIRDQMQEQMEEHYGQSDQPKSVAFGNQTKKMSPIVENSNLEFDDTEIHIFETTGLNEKSLEEHEMDGKRATIRKGDRVPISCC